ncbi:anti-sigma factor family protein [Marinobacter sp. M1N3S26]|uniref:anti-sigma factor family protein n=1 Tax=Marinobacter sp. M1N3S26 TaxID=3382299 RepID=UPI00387B0374
MSKHTDSEIEMNCGELRANVDRLLSGDLSREDRVRLFNHAARCRSCGEYLDWAHEVQRLVIEVAPNEPPSDDFETRVFDAASGGRGKVSVKPRSIGFAVAAAVVLAVVLWPMASWKPGDTANGNAAALAVLEPEVRQVRVAFASEEALENVQLTLELPDNVELEPFPGRHTLSWQVDLSPGDNVLTLPLRVLYPAEGELVARLDDGGRRKTFRAPIPVGLVDPGATE